ncbi:ABC transporter permease subunit [Comamonas sp. NLF-1-9]|uniref:ABC transporter permease subunit n=1 Tax=Comamonas sp. NLF-1-9 TaxID=2853163 RepID=UPI0021074D29|nr:ABC transporter permease subunit [Comamonas sp. NLF-1-9]
MVFDWSSIWAAWPDLMAGAWMTLKITALGLLGGCVIGALSGIVVTYIQVPINRRNALYGAAVLVLIGLVAHFAGGPLARVPGGVLAALVLAALALLLWRRPEWLGRGASVLAQLFILVIRGTPIVVQVMFIYFALPLLVNLRIDGYTAAIFTLMINSGAYIAEIVRAGLLSVPKGLHEAGLAMGLPFYKIMAYIVGPVALRRMIPTMGNQCIISLKDSSLFIVIGVAELTRQGQEIIATNFRAVEIWGTVAIIYLFMTGCIALVLKVVEHRTRIL